MKKLMTYQSFINESDNSDSHSYFLPTYQQCREICDANGSPFYETKLVIESFNVSLFNYRLAQSKDFDIPGSIEMRGICFVFNKDGSLHNRYLLLEKFFNLNQVSDSMYSVVKNLKIKSVSNKEDGSIASFIRLPNGHVYGKSKMSFESDQSNGINRIYKNNPNIKRLVDWSLDNDIVAIFEFVSPKNRIVLRYAQEELILLRLRDNKTGKHLDMREYLNEIGDVRIAPFEDEHSLDDMIEKSKSEIDKEGWIVTFDNGKMIKIKTSFYTERHGLLTEDIYREHIIIGYILDDKIDDILGQIPEDEKEAHDRINKIISIVRLSITDKVSEIKNSYNIFVNSDSVKEYALRHKNDPNFGFVMSMYKGADPHELAEKWIRDNTKRLSIARLWLKKKDPTFFFEDSDKENEA